MRPTLEYITRQFEHYNALCFEGLLPKVELRISNARTFLGQLRFKQKRILFGFVRNTEIVLSISARYDLPEDEIDDTLIHEMIHLHILVNRIKDSSAHGPSFRAMMADINRRYGRHITVSHRRSGEMTNQDTQIRPHFVCVSYMKGGRVGITLAAKTRILQLWHEMQRVSEVVDFRWYTTKDPWFNRFRRSQTLKIYSVNVEDLKQHLTTAQELTLINGQIFIRRREG